ncbi:MAG: peptide-methionine (S)-S-oxide reductase MsrA [Azonexus sp.]
MGLSATIRLLICLFLAGGLLSGIAQAATDTILLGMGCFWGAEKRMSGLNGVLEVESGYANGEVEGNYNAVLVHERMMQLGQTTKRNHAEVVKVTFDPAKVSLEAVLVRFWESHDPTQGNRQASDVGSNYRSAIYTNSDSQLSIAHKTRDVYQAALKQAALGGITTDIAPLKQYFKAEEYHQDYFKKNPNAYCGLAGTGVRYPGSVANMPLGSIKPLDPTALNLKRQLIVFEAEDCTFCKQFKAEVLDQWKSSVPVARTPNPQPPAGWTLEKSLFATPTVVLFESGKEISRFTGYSGDKQRFWKWLGFHLLTPAQQKIAFEQGTEQPGTGSHLDEKRPGTFVDPITGAALFRSDAKFSSGTGWPSFFNPLPGALTEHIDNAYRTHRVEVRSASSGIHLGHVFDDGPKPTGKRYCINGNVLKFVPDDIKK